MEKKMANLRQRLGERLGQLLGTKPYGKRLPTEGLEVSPPKPKETPKKEEIKKEALSAKTAIEEAQELQEKWRQEANHEELKMLAATEQEEKKAVAQEALNLRLGIINKFIGEIASQYPSVMKTCGVDNAEDLDLVKLLEHRALYKVTPQLNDKLDPIVLFEWDPPMSAYRMKEYPIDKVLDQVAGTIYVTMSHEDKLALRDNIDDLKITEGAEDLGGFLKMLIKGATLEREIEAYSKRQEFIESLDEKMQEVQTVLLPLIPTLSAVRLEPGKYVITDEASGKK
jgi:hypothetical protein